MAAVVLWRAFAPSGGGRVVTEAATVGEGEADKRKVDTARAVICWWAWGPSEREGDSRRGIEREREGEGERGREREGQRQETRNPQTITQDVCDIFSTPFPYLSDQNKLLL